MRLIGIIGGAITLASTNAAGAAQTASPPAAAAAAVDPQKVVADVRRILSENYVLKEVRPKLDAALAKGLADGRYNVADPRELAERLNADMSAVAHDKHLGMQYAPEQSADLAKRPPGAGADDAAPSAEEVRHVVSLNHGITDLKVLPSNIRYMNYEGFGWVGPRTAEAIDNAMRFLRDGDAVIIDLRGNGGGSPEAVQYMISYFLEPNRPIVAFYMRGDPAERLSSLAKLPAERLVGKPLYVLTSGHTASAAEEFTGHVGGYKLGELIGQTTAGAGYRNEFFPVAGGYVISVSVGRAVLASTGKDWEGVGLAPTTKVEPDKALEVAQLHALRAIAAKAPAGDKRTLEARAEVLDKQLNPIATALPLPAYAGTYGERSVSVDGDRLMWRRGDGPKRPMVAVAPNEFSFADDPMTRIRFSIADKTVTGVELVRGDGSKVEAQRTR